jgi:hypothetical protein
LSVRQVIIWSLLVGAIQSCAVIGERGAPRALTSIPAVAPADNADDDEIGPEFEIDADADRYFGAVPFAVRLKARAQNGTPPFTFTWDFGDGTTGETGESLTHVYRRVGRIDTFVTGRDASGGESRVQLMLFLLTPEEYVRRMNPTGGAPANGR